ncbi:hypothetical protein CCMSSC00406_0008778 [Pleurotus cornucopiae]|uniref:Uncharacterized protein n=1 Tax=Pleurotus cornucopiae TaxID=5321 RepID=A0ACB7J6P2_PLECO|nr:hypothetical protein CCMSSC00406_0008778 [Pleurotus cornucopiae]
MSKKTPLARPPPRPSSTAGFVDTMAASQQAHIDQLVQQNRTLQHGVKKLHEELAAEQKRGQQVVQKIQEQWHVERLQWQEGCDTLQACHKLEYLRLTMDLEKEQDNVLKERNRTRLEKVARLQRDFKITMFQARENELERQVEDLTMELQSLTASKENDMAEKESSRAAALKKIKAEYAEFVAQAQADAAGYADIEEERDRLQEELGKLREEHARLKVSSDSSSTRLERATLQLEGSKSTIAALQQKNDELVRNVADLQHQLGKWQTLDVKGVEEIEIERKKRVESETRLMQLQGRLDQMEKKEAELSGLLEKEKRRTEKAKEAALDWKAAAEGYEGDLTTFEGQIAQLQNEITQLQTDLETERAISRPARARRPAVKEAVQDSEDEEIEVSPPKKPTSRVKKPPNSKPKQKPPSTTKGGRRAASPAVEVVEAGPSNSQHEEDEPSSGASADEVEEIMELPVTPSPVAATKRKGKAKTNDVPPANDTVKKPGRGKVKVKAKADVNGVSDVEVEEAPPQAAKRSKGKQKVAEQDSEVEVVDASQAKPAKGKSKAAASKPAAQTRTRKRKVSPESSIENDVEEVEPKNTKQKRGGRAGSVAPSTAAKPGKNKKRTPSPVPDDPPPQEAQPKKKRKINLFPAAQTGSSFDFIGDGLGGGLGIPTELSPIKDTQAIPSRSETVIAILGYLVRIALL